MANPLQPDPAAWVVERIEGFCRGPANTLQGPTPEPAWDAPLVGFASGADPLWQQYKEEAVGPFHWTPAECFELAFPGVAVEPEELTVIAWVLPQTATTRADNRRETRYPAERWARSRIFGEQFNGELRRHVAQALTEAGAPAVAPMLLPAWRSLESPRWGFASAWSERHAAHACGLGTFGLCDGLITPVGKAVRIGSVVARAAIPPTPRPYADHRAYCLFFSHGACGECIGRCPVGAISRRGHDKTRCQAHLHPATADYVQAHYGFAGYGCGLCQIGVPCEAGVPEHHPER